MMIEGEEEAGSVGFEETVKKYKEFVGDVDAILVRFVSAYFPGESTGAQRRCS